jgi:hypothetical protein
LPNPYGQRQQARADLQPTLLRRSLIDEEPNATPGHCEVNESALIAAAAVRDRQDWPIPDRREHLLGRLQSRSAHKDDLAAVSRAS